MIDDTSVMCACITEVAWLQDEGAGAPSPTGWAEDTNTPIPKPALWGEYNINKWGGDAHLDVARRDEPPGVISAFK